MRPELKMAARINVSLTGKVRDRIFERAEELEVTTSRFVREVLARYVENEHLLDDKVQPAQEKEASNVPYNPFLI